jgi:hypothetical protein
VLNGRDEERRHHRYHRFKTSSCPVSGGKKKIG